MKITIRVEITTDWDETDTFEVCQLERPDRQLEPEKIGLSLAEGKDVLHMLQRVVVAAQAEEVCMLRRFCTHCHRFLELKDRRIRKVDTGLWHRALSQCPDRLLSVRDAFPDGVSV
ncbi:hypothetical protein PPGU19_088670 (plasmid) [Paraburkholderia sp. PGU19]|nr:hypothetical protein PPGU19_088670 [Paraburkholderia sp. PGU19]